MITDSEYECPVCSKPHKSRYRLQGIAVIACPDLTPAGETRTFPAASLIVVGAGLYVDSMPDKPVTEADALIARNLKLQELQARKQRKDADEAVESQIKALEAELGGEAPASVESKA